MEDVMGTRDMLVTNEDLGGSIDGSETLVQEKTDHHAKQPAKHAEPVLPEKPVSSKDDHADTFFSTDITVEKPATTQARNRNADADLEFQRQRKAEGVQQEMKQL